MLVLLLACGQAAPPVPEVIPPLPPELPRAAPDPERLARLRAILQARLGEAYDRPVEGFATSSPARGQAVYDTHCASCHGFGGQGEGLEGSTPWDFTDPAFRTAYSEAGRVSVVRDGLPTTDMPGFAGQLTEQQIVDAADFVRHLLDLQNLP